MLGVAGQEESCPIENDGFGPLSTTTIMSDSSVVFRRTKSKPTARARAQSPDANDTGSDQNSQTDSPITLASKLKNKAKRAKPKSRLSFGGDDDAEVCVLNDLKEFMLMGAGLEGDGEVFQVKKSNLSQKLKLGSGSACAHILSVYVLS